MITKFSDYNKQIETENFKKWFNGSKVVDDKGNPLLMYHGTEWDSPLDTFDGNRGIGWFTDNKEYALNYTRGLGMIMVLYLSIKNPYILKIEPEKLLTLDEFNKLTGFKSSIKHKNVGIQECWFWYDNTHTDFVELLIKSGYDGLQTLEHKKYICWCPFYQNQIKSATDNNGNFSNSSNINENI